MHADKTATTHYPAKLSHYCTQRGSAVKGLTAGGVRSGLILDLSILRYAGNNYGSWERLGPSLTMTPDGV